MTIGRSAKVENANVDKVTFYLDKLLAELPGHCGCPRCRMDVTALALNTLPPHYYVNPERAKDHDMGSPWILIDIAVREAMDRVRKSPNHQILEKNPSVGLDNVSGAFRSASAPASEDKGN